jgi:hypothetical protein
MRVDDIVYFSPGYRFIDLDWDSRQNLVSAFRDRVERFYLTPARELNDAGHAFASGVLCVATIDFLARVETGEERVRQRIVKWLGTRISAFADPDPHNQQRTLARRFYDEFRNGLVHEGCIKNGGQFSYDYENVIEVQRPVMIVNPTILWDGISEAFDRYLEEVLDDDFIFQGFRCALLDCFRTDMEIVRA